MLFFKAVPISVLILFSISTLANSRSAGGSNSSGGSSSSRPEGIPEAPSGGGGGGGAQGVGGQGCVIMPDGNQVCGDAIESYCTGNNCADVDSQVQKAASASANKKAQKYFQNIIANFDSLTLKKQKKWCVPTPKLKKSYFSNFSKYRSYLRKCHYLKRTRLQDLDLAQKLTDLLKKDNLKADELAFICETIETHGQTIFASKKDYLRYQRECSKSNVATNQTSGDDTSADVSFCKLVESEPNCNNIWFSISELVANLNSSGGQISSVKIKKLTRILKSNCPAWYSMNCCPKVTTKIKLSQVLPNSTFNSLYNSHKIINVMPTLMVASDIKAIARTSKMLKSLTFKDTNRGSFSNRKSNLKHNMKVFKEIKNFLIETLGVNQSLWNKALKRITRAWNKNGKSLEANLVKNELVKEFDLQIKVAQDLSAGKGISSKRGLSSHQKSIQMALGGICAK